ncbi:MAG: hypothetical protein R2812_08895 [Gelidibacter sp.]
MKIRKYTLALVCVLGLLASCNKKDDSIPTIVERDRTQQQVVDNDSLIGYLETHYYNSSVFETAGDHTISELVITELPKDESGNYLALPDPDNNTLLIDAVGAPLTTTYQETSYDYYVLKLNEGGGNAPEFTDNIRLNYSGNLQDETVFDSTVNPADLDLLNLIQGWRLVMPQFKAAESFVENSDGTVTYSNYGLGVMFLPSGLAYFATPPYSVPAYSNLIFKFELYQTEVNDHDSDLIPSYLEDLDGDGNVFNDDTDADNVPNFLDADDDGDGVLTKYEDIDGDGDPTNDIGANGIPKYLDPLETASNQDN